MSDSETLDDPILDWYRHLYGEVEEGWLSFFSIDRRTGQNRTEWCRATDLEAATDITRRLNVQGCVWNGVAVRTHRTSGRGGAAECGWITALWADIDFVDPGHQGNERLPPDVDAAKHLVADFPIKPTALTHTGGGLQAWYLLDEVTAVEDLGDLLEAFGATWAKIGADAGYHIDNVFDLARIMRPAGSHNRKLDTARPVRLEGARWERRYGVSELRDACIDPPTPVIDRKRSEVPYIGPDRPGDEYAARHDGHELLGAYGFHSPRQDPNGDTHYHAPHRSEREGTGATVYAADGHVTIWSETFCANHPPVKVRHGYDLFGLYVDLEHGGDFAQASRELRSKGYGAEAEHPFGERPATPANVNPETGEVLRANLADEDGDGPRLLTVRWVDEALADMPPEPDVIVSNLIRRGELTVLGAPRAIGKTWASLNLAHLVAEGSGHLFGAEVFRIERPYRVLYLQGELGHWGSAARWQMVSGGRPHHIAEVFDRCRIRALTRRVTTTTDGVTTSDEQIEVAVDHRIESTIEAIDADLVIVDPWATYYSGKENSNDEVEAAVNAITDIARRTDTAWWIVHHITQKAVHGNLAEPEDLWRGASRLADAVSTRLTILPHYTPAKVRELGMDRIEARRYIDIHTLERNGPSVPTQHAQRDGWWWKAWEPVNPDGGRPPALSDRDVVEVLRGGPITSKRRLMDALDVGSHSTLDRHLERLVELGIVTIDDGPKRSKIYRLADEGGLP